MAVSALCPSCGAPVVFKSASSVFAVCDYCQSTLVRHDQNLEDIGKMAALVEDRSPLCLGAEGVYQGVHFALIGRIQVQYAQGYWNEWHLLFDDMKTGWLSEFSGQYVLTFMSRVQEPVPAFDTLKVDGRLTLQSQVWSVSNIEQATCVAGAGELPFKVGAGYPVNTVDLKNGPNFATLDYSESPPLLFVGESVPFASLRLRNLREDYSAPVREVSAQVFRCLNCGAPLSARSVDILAVGCATCGAVVDTADANRRVLSSQLGMMAGLAKPSIPLGSLGVFDGNPVEVIGFLVKEAKVSGIPYHWREYLLAGEQGSYRWLTEYNGHWNLADGLQRSPRSAGMIDADDIRYDGVRYRHYATTPTAEVIQVTGEFTWRVARGDVVRVVDYVAPPVMLSKESSGNEVTWSRATYLASEDVAQAFKLPAALPKPVGVFANQPNPWRETTGRVLRRFGQLALATLVIQVLFVFLSRGALLLNQDFVHDPRAPEEVQTREFELTGKARKIAVRHATSLDNNWLGVDMMLVNKQSGMAWPAHREIAFYQGYDDGHWTEGSRDDEVVFRDIPKGIYYLTIDPDMAPDKIQTVRDRVEIRIAGTGWSNWLIALVFLGLFPLFSYWRQHAFETQRWADSDHAPAETDGGDD